MTGDESISLTGASGYTTGALDKTIDE